MKSTWEGIIWKIVFRVNL